MKISIDVDEAGIIKNVLNGVNQKEIERQLIIRVQEQIMHSVESKIVQKFNETSKDKDFNFDTVIEKKMKDRMLVEMKQIFKDWIEDNDSDMDDKVREILGNYIDEWLKDNEISFSFVHKVKKSK